MGEQLPHADLFEVRADFVRDLDLRALLAGRARPLLLTCRPESEGGRWPDGDAAGRRRILAEAVELGFDYVDVEARAGFDEIVAAKAGRGLVLSWHDFEGTPDGLDALYERMAAQRPDVVKIAVRARSAADLGRLLAFARRCAPRARTGRTGPRRDRHGPRGHGLARPGRPLRRAVHVRGADAAAARRRPGQLPARAARLDVPRRLDRPRRRASTASSAATSCAACRRRSTTAPSQRSASTRSTSRCRRSRSTPSCAPCRRSASRASA